MEKTGECFWWDENGLLWLAESFMDNEGNVDTQQTLLEE